MKILEEGNLKIVEIVKEEAKNRVNNEKLVSFLQSCGVYESDENGENIC